MAAHPKIGPRQLDYVAREGAAVVRWQRSAGLPHAQAMCVSMVLAGLAPFVGWLWLDWTPTAMLLFLVVDIVAVLAGDLLKLAIALPMVRDTHAEDHRAQKVLNIVGGLRDGTGTYTETGRDTSPLLLFGMALPFGGMAAAILLGGAELLGLERVDLRQQEGFLWFAGASVALHVGSSLLSALAARVRGRGVIYLDCGGVLGLGAGLLFLVWLPIMFGGAGVILLLVVLFLFRLGFGLFALWYLPRVSADLEGYLRDPASLQALPQRRRVARPA